MEAVETAIQPGRALLLRAVLQFTQLWTKVRSMAKSTVLGLLSPAARMPTADFCYQKTGDSK